MSNTHLLDYTFHISVSSQLHHLVECLLGHAHLDWNHGLAIHLDLYYLNMNIYYDINTLLTNLHISSNKANNSKHWELQN